MVLNRHDILISALEDEGGYYNIQIDSTLEMSVMKQMLKEKLFKLAKRGPNPFYNRFKITPKGMKLAKEAERVLEVLQEPIEGGDSDGTNPSTL
jgi:predicted transcriptional regulator